MKRKTAIQTAAQKKRQKIFRKRTITRAMKKKKRPQWGPPIQVVQKSLPSLKTKMQRIERENPKKNLQHHF